MPIIVKRQTDGNDRLRATNGLLSRFAACPVRPNASWSEPNEPAIDLATGGPMSRHVNPGAALLVAVLIAFSFSGRDGTAAPKFDEWSAPVNVGPVVNTGFGEFAPHLSKDMESLYFTSTRPAAFGSFGGEDLWVSRRDSVGTGWNAPLNLGPSINTSANERSPALSRDGHYLFFASDRPGGFGALDLWVSWRRHTHDDFGWEAPVNLGDLVNSATTDAGPSFFQNDEGGIPQLFLASNRPGGPGGLDIYVSAFANGSFQPPAPVQPLNTPQLDLTPTVRHDGLEIVIASARPNGVGSQDLWAAIRDTVFEPWSAPVNLGPTVNSTSSENFPSISADRQTLLFNSDRPGGLGSNDLYISTRGR
jgi:hypothetical protein